MCSLGSQEYKSNLYLFRPNTDSRRQPPTAAQVHRQLFNWLLLLYFMKVRYVKWCIPQSSTQETLRLSKQWEQQEQQEQQGMYCMYFLLIPENNCFYDQQQRSLLDIFLFSKTQQSAVMPHRTTVWEAWWWSQVNLLVCQMFIKLGNLLSLNHPQKKKLLLLTSAGLKWLIALSNLALASQFQLLGNFKKNLFEGSFIVTNNHTQYNVVKLVLCN